MKKNIFTTIVYSFFLGCSLLQLTAQNVTILVSHDSYVSQGEPDINFSNDLNFKVKKSSTGNADRVGYLGFDVNSLSTTYEQVLLKVSQISGPSRSLKLLPTDTNVTVDEDLLTWNTQPTSYVEMLYGGVREGNAIYYDVTEYVNKRILSENQVGFQLFSNIITTSTQTFASKEASNLSEKPQLLFYTSIEKNSVKFKYEYKEALVKNQHSDTNPDTFEIYTAQILEKVDDVADNLDQYGGWDTCSHQFDATGFFRTEFKNSIWYLVDPEGNMFYTVGLNSVEKGGGINLPDAIIDYGVNTLGSWSDETITGIPYCPRLNILVKFKNTNSDIKATYALDVLPVWEPTFESYLDEAIPGLLVDYIGDPWVLGYFMDNELKFSSQQLEKSLNLATGNAQYLKADEYMKSIYGNGYSSSNVTDEDEMTYVGMVAEKYFSTVTAALRKVDPAHLILGSRINGNVRYRTPVIEAAGKYIDVLSINYYREWNPQDDAMALWAEYTDIPWFTTEYYVKGEDAGFADENGAGWTVKTQEERAFFYENWVIKTMKDPNCVGHHWFRYIDKDESNKGIISINHEWYSPIVESFTKVNKTTYSLRESILHGYSDMSVCDVELNTTRISNSIESLIIYPNPVVENRLNIHFSNLVSEGYKLSIIDSTGKLVLNSDDIEVDMILTIDVENLSRGLYLVKLEGTNGGVFTKKFIK